MTGIEYSVMEFGFYMLEDEEILKTLLKRNNIIRLMFLKK